MAQSWTRYVTFQPSVAIRADFTEVGSVIGESIPELMRLRVETSVPGLACEAMLRLPGPQLVGPIDVPFQYNVPASTRVDIQLAASSDIVHVSLVLSSLPDSPNVWGATRLAFPGRGDATIPSGVVAVAVLSGATATFKDASATAFATFVGPGIVGRPRMAQFVSVSNAAAPVLFYY